MEIADRATPGEERLVTRKESRDRLEVYRPGPAELRRNEQARPERPVRQAQPERSTRRSAGEPLVDRDAQKPAEQVRGDRTAQRPAEQVRTDRTAQRNLKREMREQVMKRDRTRVQKPAEVERGTKGRDGQKLDARSDGGRRSNLSPSRPIVSRPLRSSNDLRLDSEPLSCAVSTSTSRSPRLQRCSAARRAR